MCEPIPAREMRMKQESEDTENGLADLLASNDNTYSYCSFKCEFNFFTSTMKIGELAARSGAAVGTIRFYEARGILQKPRRGPGGQREYGAADLERLSFIMRCRNAGMKLECVERFLAYEDDPSLGTPWLLDRIDEYLDGIQKLRTDLDRTEAYLRGVRSRMAAGETACLKHASEGAALESAAVENSPAGKKEA